MEPLCACRYARQVSTRAAHQGYRCARVLPGWSGVFNASTGINPNSGHPASEVGTNPLNNGLPRASYSFAGDGARAGQVFNDELYAGISSAHVGTLTFGRQRALGTDAMLAYDPAGGSYAFSDSGSNGTMAGGRWNEGTSQE